MFMNGILGLHSLLRWAILVLLIVNISHAFFNNNKPYSKQDRSWNLRLVIITHINLLIGLFQYFFGAKGFAYIKEYGMGEVMKNGVLRFYAVEHILGMLLAVVLITISSSISKKAMENNKAKHTKLLLLYVLSLIVIIACVPWPFRFADVPWFRSLY